VANEIRSFFLNGPAGRLEALLNQGEPGASHAALVCHPHPLFGGTMHNKVVYHAMKTLSSFGFPVLRFNFRGAGLSEGEHDNGHGEVDDVRAALNWLGSQFHLPIIFCGFSFGTVTGMRASCGDERVMGIISLGTPVGVEGRAYKYQFLHDCTQPKLFISGSRDQYGAEASVRHLVESAPEPKELVIVAGADHFFEGHLAEMQTSMRAWVTRLFPQAGQAGAL
jgi:alpha/beta superfamily hydrolase